MIIQWFAEMFFKVITGLLNWINLPGFPETLWDYLNDFLNIFVDGGLSIFFFFVPSEILSISVTMALITTSFKYGYFFVIWILKKIPLAGIS